MKRPQMNQNEPKKFGEKGVSLHGGKEKKEENLSFEKIGYK